MNSPYTSAFWQKFKFEISAFSLYYFFIDIQEQFYDSKKSFDSGFDRLDFSGFV
jgi:hypothetical protein